MTTRQQLVDAAVRRYEAAQQLAEREAAMRAAHAQFVTARDLHLQAIAELAAATKAHADIEQRLIEHNRSEQK